MKSPVHFILLLLIFLLLTLPALANDNCNDCSKNGAEHCAPSGGNLLVCKNHCWQPKWSCRKGDQCIMKPGPTCVANGKICEIWSGGRDEGVC
ncbi:hypothetical protein J4E85_009785 [Alternaria conjuncta]|uniref:uncharacterized protein n=1 Tax=Alternaria conjuncta TaxID=181017 RepID=UPI00221E6AC4|nr:uncharacterized protein J4E85_009785 [Alternaria conjuncta]KAI4917693.1 hypothetical protein J4E85_009785 [Alternaria conjuncta]